MQHPLPIGTPILSINGEQDDDDGVDRFTGPMANGRVERADYYASQGWTYCVAFGNGTGVFIDECELRDKASYIVG